METGENVNRLAEETRPGDIRGCPLLVLMNLIAVPLFNRRKLRWLFEKIADQRQRALATATAVLP